MTRAHPGFLASSSAGQNMIDVRLLHQNGTWLSVEMTANDLTDDPNVAASC
jgi:hypothetical protein